MPDNKEVKTLLRDVKAQGYTVFMGGGGHYQLKDLMGNVVVSADNGLPLTIPSSPSDPRWRRNAVAELRRSGVNLNGKKVKPERKPPDARRQASSVAKLRVEQILRTGATVHQLVEHARKEGVKVPSSFEDRVKGLLSGDRVPYQATLDHLTEVIDAWGRTVAPAAPGREPEPEPAVEEPQKITVELGYGSPYEDRFALFVDISAAFAATEEKSRDGMRRLLNRLAEALGIPTE